MSRTILALGAHGQLVQTAQNALAAAGAMTSGNVDSWYGKGTMGAVRSFQQVRSLATTGIINDTTWSVLLPEVPLPSLAQRCLQLTAAFEGHDYTLAVGNFDGAWLTWGIIGFTLKHGEVQKIVNEIATRLPAYIQQDFGVHAQEIVDIMNASAAKQEAWANAISTPKGLLGEPWRTAFRLLGLRKEVQEIQQRLALADYFAPALHTAADYGLTTELGIALCFDIHVQNGGIRKAAAERIKVAPTESTTLARIAKAIAATAKKAYQDDVLKRKLTIATGQGTVHGVQYTLENWGLAAVPANVASAAGGGPK